MNKLCRILEELKAIYKKEKVEHFKIKMYQGSRGELWESTIWVRHKEMRDQSHIWAEGIARALIGKHGWGLRGKKGEPMSRQGGQEGSRVYKELL